MYSLMTFFFTRCTYYANQEVEHYHYSRNPHIVPTCQLLFMLYKNNYHYYFFYYRLILTLFELYVAKITYILFIWLLTA